jgi:hypothetical protein
MKTGVLQVAIFFFCMFWVLIPKVSGQELLLLDVNDGNRVVNDGVINVSTTDLSTLELSAHLKIVNQTDKALAVFMKKIIHFQVDSTSNYFCLNPKCWPNSDSTNIADSIAAGATDSSFVTHYDHFYVYEKPIPPGLTSITYLFYDYTTLDHPVEAQVTMNYWVSGVGVAEWKPSSLYLFPVPATQKVFIESKHSTSSNIQRVSLIDSFGRHFTPKMLMAGEGRVELDVSNMPAGVYSLHAITNKQEVLTSKLLIQH